MAVLTKAQSFLLAVLFVTFVTKTTAKPGNFYEFGSEPHEDKCKEGDLKVVEVCQRCAKQTKSPIVYPMCCVNDDDVFNWCERYINYGKKSK
ncbi:uncharacterized protein LOC135135358 [Zophobas morio]|uniref:uncharacterized protein LOC135135358 n=1 Tax=Zophobas morio TaxID=2755281 RepID=UPI003082ACD2